MQTQKWRVNPFYFTIINLILLFILPFNKFNKFFYKWTAPVGNSRSNSAEKERILKVETSFASVAKAISLMRLLIHMLKISIMEIHNIWTIFQSPTEKSWKEVGLKRRKYFLSLQKRKNSPLLRKQFYTFMRLWTLKK